MGGEGGPTTTVAATLNALQQNPLLSVILVGDERKILASAPSLEAFSGRYDIVHTPKTFLDTEKPATILRSGHETSLYRCVEIHQQGRASAVVSAGNTGALLLLGRHLLKNVVGVELPAIVATLPNIRSQALLLDVGANLACSPRQLEQFAIMGAVLARKQFGNDPRVALLNVGAEDYKGTAIIQDSARLLEAQDRVNFTGFVEANSVFDGQAEVIVCDGFVGNVKREQTVFKPAELTPAQKANPSVVEQILTGWGNLVKSHFVDLEPNLKAESEKRLTTCNSCDMRNGGTCSPNKTGIHVITGEEVRGCGCRLAAKALSPGSVCPLGKW